MKNVTTRPEHYKAFDWCTKNRIKIYPKLRDGKYILVQTIDGVAYTSGKKYEKDDFQSVIWDYYLYLYKEYNNDTN